MVLGLGFQGLTVSRFQGFRVIGAPRICRGPLVSFSALNPKPKTLNLKQTLGSCRGLTCLVLRGPLR